MAKGPPGDSDEQRLRHAADALGHAFRDPRLLLRAITHSSIANEQPTPDGHNELLEFVGDAVVSLVAVEALVARSPQATEGELTERRAAYVSEEALARRAQVFDLDVVLRTASMTKVTTAMRADLVEALIGAVYLDAGMDAARAATLRLLGEPPERVAPAALAAKKVLQEHFQRLFGRPPSYEVEQKPSAKHAPRFVAWATFDGVRLGQGEAASKKDATERAAAEALRDLVDDAAICARVGQAPRERK